MAKGHVLHDDNGDLIDGAGNIIPACNFAGINFNNNTSELAIGLVDSFYLVKDWDVDMPGLISDGDNTSNDITAGATGNYRIHTKVDGESAAGNKIFEWYVFELSSIATAITAATAADPVVITAAGHGFTGGEKVAIKSVGGMVEINDRIFTVADVSGDTFELTDDGGSSPANDIDGTGFTAYTSGGTVQEATQTIIHLHSKFATGGTSDIVCVSDNAIVPLTLNNTVELYIKGITDTTNFIHEHSNFSIQRIN